MRSQEVLAPPNPPRRPVLRVLAGLALGALVVTGIVLKLAEDPAPTPPAAAPRAASAFPESAPEAAADLGPVYPPTPLDGHWVIRRLPRDVARAIDGARPRQRLTLLVRSTALVLWVGSKARPNQRIIGYEAIYVEGHRVHLSPVGASSEKAVYRWRIRDDRLTFRLLDRTRGASPSVRLVSLPFVRRDHG